MYIYGHVCLCDLWSCDLYLWSCDLWSYNLWSRDLFILTLRFLVGIQFLLPLTMCLGWMLSVAMIVRAVVREKESRIKEVMQMMGLGRGQLWGAWFLTSFLTLLISVLFITLALKVSTLSPLSPLSSLPLSLCPLPLSLQLVQ